MLPRRNRAQPNAAREYKRQRGKERKRGEDEDMAFFTDKFLNARREDLLRHIYRFQYQLNGGTWYTGEINSKEVVGTNVVVFVNMPSSGAADTVTAVRVYDNNDSLAGSQSVNLKRQSYNTGLLRFTFPLIEATTE